MPIFLFLTVVQGLVAAALVFIVLIQRSEGGGLGIGGGQLVQDGIPAFEDGTSGGMGDLGNNDHGSGIEGMGNANEKEGGGLTQDRAGGEIGDVGAKNAEDHYGGGSYDNSAAVPESVISAVQGFSPGPVGGSAAGGGGTTVFGGTPNYGQEGGFSGGGGSEAATSSSGQIAQANPAPAAVVPAGPTPEELAERERLRIKAIQDEAERLVRARYDSNLGNTWRDALVNKFNTDAQGELDTAYGSNRTSIIEALRAAGYEATPLATAKLAGLDTQKTREAGLIPTTRTSRFTDVDARRNASLVEAIRLAREQSPSWADLATSANSLADTNINAYLTALQTNPGAVYKPNFTATSAITETGPTAPQATAAEAFRNALLTVSNPAAAARVA